MELSFLILTLFWSAVNAEDTDTDTADNILDSISLDLDPDDCLFFNTENCTPMGVDDVCPPPCGFGRKMEYWKCNGELKSCKVGCKKLKACPEDPPEMVANNLEEAVAQVTQQQKEENTALVVKASIRNIVKCAPAGCARMKFDVVYTIFLNGQKVKDLVTHVDTPCCCKQKPGTGGGPIKLLTCAVIQQQMSVLAWLLGCPEECWPPNRKDAIEDQRKRWDIEESGGDDGNGNNGDGTDENGRDGTTGNGGDGGTGTSGNGNSGDGTDENGRDTNGRE